MALRINHIQVLLMALNGPEFDYHSQSIMAEAVHALEAELHRLTHGPFTLAEAIASGRPFYRRCWNNITVCERVDNLDGLRFSFIGGKYDLISLDDLTATDYELAEGGE